MKIDGDLRAVIRAAEKAQNRAVSQSYKDDEVSKLIQDLLLRKPATKARIDKARKKLEILNKRQEALDEEFNKANDPFNEIGVCTDLMTISGKKSFEAAGGKLPIYMAGRWAYDRVIAELAAAEPKERQSILLKYGINWSE